MHPDIATLRSRCGWCDGRIHIGDPIMRDVISSWFHKDCYERNATGPAEAQG